MGHEIELRAALEASERASRYLHETYERFVAIPDAPSDISTDADRQSQEIILAYLHQQFPEDALCAEEATPVLAQTPRTGPRLWIVDPIDGTRGFARKNGEFSVMIAFVANGQIEVGVVAEPARARVTYAVRGGGCWRLDGQSNSPVRCRVSGAKQLAEATLVQSRSKSGQTSRAVALLKPMRTVEAYSAGIKLAIVARGEADVYVNDYPKFSDWDIAAGDILVTEAGGKVTGLKGQTLSYGLEGAPQTHGLLATNGLIHDSARAAWTAPAG